VEAEAAVEAAAVEAESAEAVTEDEKETTAGEDVDADDEDDELLFDCVVFREVVIQRLSQSCGCVGCLDVPDYVEVL
jgi:alkylhydroperoxidase family enzyme